MRRDYSLERFISRSQAVFCKCLAECPKYSLCCCGAPQAAELGSHTDAVPLAKVTHSCPSCPSCSDLSIYSVYSFLHWTYNVHSANKALHTAKAASAVPADAHTALASSPHMRSSSGKDPSSSSQSSPSPDRDCSPLAKDPPTSSPCALPSCQGALAQSGPALPTSESFPTPRQALRTHSSVVSEVTTSTSAHAVALPHTAQPLLDEVPAASEQALPSCQDAPVLLGDSPSGDGSALAAHSLSSSEHATSLAFLARGRSFHTTCLYLCG